MELALAESAVDKTSCEFFPVISTSCNNSSASHVLGGLSHFIITSTCHHWNSLFLVLQASVIQLVTPSKNVVKRGVSHVVFITLWQGHRRLCFCLSCPDWRYSKDSLWWFWLKKFEVLAHPLTSQVNVYKPGPGYIFAVVWQSNHSFLQKYPVSTFQYFGSHFQSCYISTDLVYFYRLI